MNAETYRQLKEKSIAEAKEAMFLTVFREDLVSADKQRVITWMCSECGAIVRNTDTHFEFHQRSK